MKDYGFIRVAAASPRVRVADVAFNTGEICTLISEAEEKGVSLVAFPELSVTGSTCGDLLGNTRLLRAAEEGIEKIRAYTEGHRIAAVVGAPLLKENELHNCAVVIMDGKVAGCVSQTGFPDEDGKRPVFTLGGVSFGVGVGEVLPAPGTDLILHLVASNETYGKHAARKRSIGGYSEQTVSGYVYACSGYGESTQDAVYAGASMIFENGRLLAENERFQTGSSMIVADIDVDSLRALRRSGHASATGQAWRKVDLGAAAPTDFEAQLCRESDPYPFLAKKGQENELCLETLDILTLGLAYRLEHIGAKKAVLGISGGLDSTLALLVTVRAFDKLGIPRSGIIGITMPGLGTSSRTRGNAWTLMEKLGITAREIPIAGSVEQHFRDIGHSGNIKDTAYENAQARERTQILMDVANMEGGLVVGTGDLSELALGWCTYNGDHMSMYAVNASIPKTQVRQLCTWAAEHLFPEAGETLRDIVATPISPELKKEGEGGITQLTEDLIGPYELNDFYLYHFLRFGAGPDKIGFLARKAFKGTYDDETIHKWLRNFLRRFFSQQFKRSCMPDGPQAGPVSLSPRGGWKMPSDAAPDTFLKDCF